MNSGIYQICIGEYSYFGSSKNVKKRINEHKSALNRGKHYNRKMQSVFNKHKEFDAFQVYECDEDILLQVEQEYIDTHYGLPDCMNLDNTAQRGGKLGKRNALGKTWKQEIVQCPHCCKEGGASPMKQWHFDNCKEKK